MDNFIVKTENGVAYISNETVGFIIKAEKNRVLTSHDTGAIMIATLYRETSCFEQVCDYVFEAADTNISTGLFQQAVAYFFTTCLNTSHYVKKVPLCSSLYTGAIFADNAVVVC